MNKDLLNILSNSNKDIDNQQLMDYLHGKLAEADVHELEKMMADDPLLSDAVEGLGQLRKKDIQEYVEDINKNLHKNLEKKKQRREKRRFKDNPWGYLALVVIIMLCIAAYWMVRKVLFVHGHTG